MREYLRNKNLRTKLLLGFSILIVLPICINSIVSYYRTVRFIEDKSVAYAKVITQQINTTLDTFLKNVDNLSIQTAYSDSVNRWLTKDYGATDNADYQYGLDLVSAFRYLESMRKTAYGINNIFVYNRNLKGYYGFTTGNVITDYRITDEEWYAKVKASAGEKVLVGPYEEKQVNISRGPVISLVRKVMDLKHFEELGIIVIEININDMFVKHLKNIGLDSGSNIFILNEAGKIIYNNLNEEEINQTFEPAVFGNIGGRKSGSFQGIYRGKPSLITFYSSSFTDWKVVNVTSRNELVQGIEAVRDSSIWMGVLLIAVAFAFSVVISNGIVKPIGKLKRMISKIEEGNFEHTIEVVNRDEVGSLTLSFNRMTQRLKELIREIYIKEEEKRKAEIVALQAQINPHFTYNTLSIIKQMAVIQRSQGITRMVDSLIHLLQASAKYKEDFITVEEELKLIKAYIYIQETRYCGKFIVNYDYDEAVLPCKTLNLVLQPVVENAIFHGIQSKSGISKISISVKASEDRLEYVVEDDGVGMTVETVERILQEDSNKKSDFARVGIYNVNKRIRLHFGDHYGIQITSRVDEGTKVYMALPKMI